MATTVGAWSTKGLLGTFFVAAYYEKKLKRKDVLEANIDETVKELLKTRLKYLNLRISGGILYGVVRVYSKKMQYFLEVRTTAVSTRVVLDETQSITCLSFAGLQFHARACPIGTVSMKLLSDTCSKNNTINT